MPNAYGFTRPGQQPTPDPRMVGQQLMQGQQQQQPQQAQQPSYDPNSFDYEAPQRSKEQQLRLEGGKLMGSGGPDEDGAMAAAVGEALTRAGGGHRSNPNPYKDRDRAVRQLQRLGISEVEAELLRETL